MHRSGSLMLVLLVSIGIASCVTTTPSERSEAAATAAVVRSFVSDPSVRIFLLPLSATDPDLTFQAAVVAELDEFETVRFVDDVGEAFDGDTVQEGAVLLEIGAVPSGDRPVVTVERILGVDESVPFRVSLERSAASWRVVSLVEG